MQYIYSRVSTGRQNVDNQLHVLQERFPMARVYEEECSSQKFRPVLYGLLKRTLQPGDELIIYSLDRLARSTLETIKMLRFLQGHGIKLISHREGADYSTPVGKLVLQILASVAEMERDMISERTKAALAAKRAMGIVGGRPPLYSKEDRELILELRKQGFTFREIESQTGISHSNCFRIWKKYGTQST